jgi:hypothetical protein
MSPSQYAILETQYRKELFDAGKDISAIREALQKLTALRLLQFG